MLVDDGKWLLLTTNDPARLVEHERKVRELRRANAILMTASAFFAGEFDPQPG